MQDNGLYSHEWLWSQMTAMRGVAQRESVHLGLGFWLSQDLPGGLVARGEMDAPRSTNFSSVNNHLD
jgi:hypothetical protein